MSQLTRIHVQWILPLDSTAPHRLYQGNLEGKGEKTPVSHPTIISQRSGQGPGGSLTHAARIHISREGPPRHGKDLHPTVISLLTGQTLEQSFGVPATDGSCLRKASCPQPGDYDFRDSFY